MGEVICPRCDRELAMAPVVRDSGPAGLHLVISASPFAGAARRIVHGLKYARRPSLAAVAAEAMLRALKPSEKAEAVVPVPAGPWRWRWRGFDPAEEIAIAVSRRGDMPLARCLRRGRGRPQVGRRRAERLSDPPRVWLDAEPPRTALLVDDVWTTGATLSACACALRGGGCTRVVSLTFAHAIR